MEFLAASSGIGMIVRNCVCAVHRGNGARIELIEG